MNGSSSEKSRAERYARNIGARLAKGKAPKSLADLEDYLDRFPDEVFVALDGLVQRAAASERSDPLVLGYLFLIQCQLERIRYRVDRGYQDAVRLIEKFQHTVADLAITGRIDGNTFSMVSSALHQAGITASEELAAAMGQQAEDLVSDDTVADLAAALEAMVEECEGDPFQVTGLLAETGHAMPAQARALMATVLACSSNASLREAAIFLLLDAEPAVRRAATAELHTRVASLTSNSLRRLIAMRNWCFETERPGVDSIIRAARAKGIACAPWQEGGAEVILASAIDGSGAQGFLIVSPAGRRKRLSSVLLKYGIRDAWTAPPESQKAIRDTLAQAASETSMIPVSRGHFDQTINHHLARGLAAEMLPPAGLLQVAETIGGAEWRPELLDWQNTLAAMLAEIPHAMREPPAVRSILDDSASWADLQGIAESWFEDDQDVARIVSGTHGRQRTKMVEHVLATVIARRRDKWAELFVWTALWLREAPEGNDMPWREFVILAHALSHGHDLAQIPLMRDIAERTVAALANAPT